VQQAAVPDIGAEIVTGVSVKLAGSQARRALNAPSPLRRAIALPFRYEGS